MKFEIIDSRPSPKYTPTEGDSSTAHSKNTSIPFHFLQADTLKDTALFSRDALLFGLIAGYGRGWYTGIKWREGLTLYALKQSAAIGKRFLKDQWFLKDFPLISLISLVFVFPQISWQYISSLFMVILHTSSFIFSNLCIFFFHIM